MVGLGAAIDFSQQDIDLLSYRFNLLLEKIRTLSRCISASTILLSILRQYGIFT